MIQIMEAFASGSSKSSRFSHNVEMMLSYWLGYFLKMSYKLHFSIYIIYLYLYLYTTYSNDNNSFLDNIIDLCLNKLQ
jgi:hypothetical protein